MKPKPAKRALIIAAFCAATFHSDFLQAAEGFSGAALPLGNGQCAALPTGLVAWWKGDSLGGVGVDVGTFRGAGKLGAGYSGSGLEFGGSHDALLLPASFKLTGQDFSVETWIHRENPSTASNDNEAGEFFAGSDSGFAFGLTHEGRLYLSHIGIVSYYSTTSIRDTGWHHVAISRDGNNLSFFVDGRLNTTVSCPAVFNLQGPFAIGGLGTPYNGASYGFRGGIDELAVYSTALSPAQILAVYEAGTTGKCHSSPVPVALANATATYSQGLVQSFPPFPVSQSIDGVVVENHNGWAIYPRQGVPETAVWETVQNVGFAGGTRFAFTIQSVGHLGHHGIGRFRLSATTDPRTEFADGLVSNGDVTANWTVLPVSSAVSSEGTVLTVQPDGSLLASGNNPYSDTYTVETSTAIVGITGFRLEVLPDPSLPKGGPGRDFEGNFVLSEIAVTATPASVTPPLPPCVQPPDGLIAWYRAEGDANNTTGTNNGVFGAPKYATGKVGRAFEFDGSNEVVVPDSTTFNFAAFAAEAWIHPTSLDGDVDIILNKEVSGADTIAFEFGLKGPNSVNANAIPVGNLALHLGGVTGLPDDYSGWTDSGVKVPLNEWSHVVVAYENGVASVFLNGALGKRFTGLTGSLRTVSGPLKIGSRADNVVQAIPGTRFNGRIDEVSLYNRALSFEEITQLAQAGSSGKCYSAPPDTQAPALTLSEPTSGTVTDEQFNLSGTATDNVAVARLSWTWNGAASEASLTLIDGKFSLTGLALRPGINTIVVAAIDAAGNRTEVTREVTLTALRTLRVTDATEVQEGRRISFAVVLDSPGDVGGMTFRLNYDPAYLTEPQLEWVSEVGQSVNNVNSAISGEVSASFALPGTSLSAGANPIAIVSFRARSVPFALTTALAPKIDSLSSATGAALTRGNAVAAGSGRIRPRRVTADNNANQRLDIGDAVVVSRLQVGLEEQRTWDIGLNDLNGSANIDSGDIVRVLRTVVGLDPQPPSSAGTARQNVARAAVSTNDRVVLEFPDGPVAKIGQPYSIVVKVAKAGSRLSGLSFVVNYPAALSLTARQVGALVPAGTLPLWNSAAGTVQLAAVSPTLWPADEGVAAVLTFVPQAGFADQAGWPVLLRQVEMTGSGFDVRAVGEVNAVVKSVAIPANAPALALQRQPDGTFRLEVRAEAGFELVVEHSFGLNDWIETQVTVGTGMAAPLIVDLPSESAARFWRARYR